MFANVYQTLRTLSDPITGPTPDAARNRPSPLAPRVRKKRPSGVIGYVEGILLGDSWHLVLDCGLGSTVTRRPRERYADCVCQCFSDNVATGPTQPPLRRLGVHSI